MIKYSSFIFLLLFSSFIISCSGNNNDNDINVKAEEIMMPMSSYDLPCAEVNLYNKTIRRDTLVDVNRLNVDSVIKGLNWRYDNFGLVKQKMSGDTIYLFIQNSKYLAEEIGTTGAEEYIADVVANITAVKGVNFIYLSFKGGAHASPGLYGRDMLDDLKEIK